MFARVESRQRDRHAEETALDWPVCGTRCRRHDGGAASRLRNLAGRDGRGASGEAMTRGDALVDHGADRLEELSHRAEAAGGVKAKVADELAEDRAFLPT